MKNFIICLVAIFAACHIANAQQIVNSSPTVNIHTASYTQHNDGRFELVQSTITRDQTFLVDKYAGKVWRWVNKSGGHFEPVTIKDMPEVDESKVNFQLYIGSEGSEFCFLLNIHTGEAWKYGRKSVFTKLQMPWEEEKK